MYRSIEDLSEPLPSALPDRSARLAERVALLREVFGGERLRAALERERRRAAVTTGEVEGLYRVARGVTEAIVQQGLEGESAESLTADVFDQVAAHHHADEYLAQVVRERRPVTSALLRELHALVTAGQRTYVATDTLGRRVRLPLPHGEYKSSDTHVRLDDDSTHWYAPATESAREVDRLIELLRQRDCDDPLSLATFAHHRFTQVHPFADGNGRTARLLATYYLVRGGLLAVVLEPEDRDRYLLASRRSDEGELSALAEFLLERQVAALGRVERSLTSAEAFEGDLPSFARSLARWAAARRTLTAGADVERDGVLALVSRLQDVLVQRLQTAMEVMAQSGFPSEVHQYVPSRLEQPPPVFARHRIEVSMGVRPVDVQLGFGRQGEWHYLQTYVAAVTSNWPPVLAIAAADNEQRVLLGAVDDLGPELLGPWADEVVARAVAEYASRL